MLILILIIMILISKIRNNKINIYLDMDGVLADFNSVPDAKYIFQDAPKFFFNLEPIKENLEAIKKLNNHPNFRFFIITASPNKRCDWDKRNWVKKYMPYMKMSHVIVTRLGESKAENMITKRGILLDDYGKNVQDWINHGQIAYKITEKYNIQFWIDKIIERKTK